MKKIPILLSTLMATFLGACDGQSASSSSTAATTPSSVAVIASSVAAISSSSAPSVTSSSLVSSSTATHSSSAAPTNLKLTIQEQSAGFCRVTGIDNEVKNAGFTGAAYANADNASGAGIVWQINASASGYYDIGVQYANGGSAARNGDFTVMGGISKTFSFNVTGAWTTWTTETVNVFLDQGVNTFTLYSESNEGLPNIDYLTVTGSQTSPAACTNLPTAPVVVASSSQAASSAPTTSSSAASSAPTISSGSCKAGGVYTNANLDCGGAKLGLSCPGDAEGQPPVMTLYNSTVKNLVIKADGGADGIHCYSGNCTLQNIVWEDICEDAATLTKEGKSMTIIGGSAFNSANGAGGKPDKIFQQNNFNSTISITGGFKALGEHGKLWRSCGDCTNNGGPRNLVLDNVIIDAKIGSIAGANGNYGDTVTIKNLKIKGYKDGSPKICDVYKGVQKGNGSSTKIGEEWNTATCKVSKSDVSAL
ncbi:MAG: pectate lyase [Marinagarivorans sp.]|nr:pectate lyase [Marinagarivorans sp.]